MQMLLSSRLLSMLGKKEEEREMEKDKEKAYDQYYERLMKEIIFGATCVERWTEQGRICNGLGT